MVFAKHVNLIVAFSMLFLWPVSVTQSVAQVVQGADNRVVTPNFRQAEQYSSAYLRQFVYSTAVTPNWIGETDQFWYAFKTSEGTRYWRVNPEKETRLPLFDHHKLAGQLSVQTRKPKEPGNLQLTRVELDNEADVLKFVADETLFEYSLKSETLTKIGPAPRQAQRAAPVTRGRQREEQQEQEQERERQQRDQQEDQQQEDQQQNRNQQQDGQQQNQQQDGQQQNRNQQRDVQQNRNQQRGGQQVQRREGGEGRGGNTNPGTSDRSGFRVFSPDRKHYVFAKGHNLFFVTIPPKTEDEAVLPGEEKTSDEADEQSQQSSQQQSDQETKSEEEKNKTDADSKEQTEDKKSDDKHSDENVKDEKKSDQEGSGDQQSEDVDKKQETTGKKEVDEEQRENSDQSQKSDGSQKQTTESTNAKQNDGDSKTEQTDQQKEQTDQQNTEEKSEADSESESNENEDLPIPRVDPAWDDLAIQLTDDGVANYSFAGRVIRTRGNDQQTTRDRSSQGNPPNEINDDTKTRPSVAWSKDSQSFHVSRRDSRGVKELWVINSLGNPRPTLESYPYPMPGEENVRRTELHWFSINTQQLQQLPKKWKDESYSNIRYSPDHSHLQFLRRDRLLRNVEFCSLDLATGKIDTLFEEGFDRASISPQPPRYLQDSEEFLWWSERDGWGHYYLYGSDGKLKNQITSGTFVAARILDVDEKNRIMYFYGNGREPGENLNYQHLYSIRLDGGDLKLLDPGDANHTSILSPSKKYLIDNYSRVDLAPESVLRRADGTEVMRLEQTDLSRLHQTGWTMPETFVVKAADGVTDLYGNMYKPFDFDPNRKYPVITYVYPGPQQEGTRHTFAATSGEQQLAQIGFIVIQVGHRGGTPRRSKAYASFGYFNLRDYGLADKKSSIEQLAQMYPFIDVERVGIYGHSGGGFMTAAALMVPPYNDFFKAGFSTAGNHDNNIYNNSWSERWHGMREVAVTNNQRGQNTAQSSDSNDVRRSSDPATSLNLQVDPEDFFFDYEILNDEDPWDFDERLREEHFDVPNWDWLQDDVTQTNQEQQVQEQQQQENQNVRGDNQDGETGQERRRGRGRRDLGRDGQNLRGQRQTNQQQDSEQDEEKQDGVENNEQVEEEKQDDSKEAEQQTRFDIRVPTNAELARNLKHHLFLVHGELDNNVHPANTLRLVDALIKANKRFEMLYLPGTRHGFGSYQPYVTQRMFEFFAQRLLSDYQSGADMQYNR